MAKFPTDVDSDMIIQWIAPAGESGDRWIRIRKTTSRPRRKEPPAGPWEPRKTVHTHRGGHASEAQCPAEEQLAGNGIISVISSQGEGAEARISWVKLPKTLQGERL